MIVTKWLTEVEMQSAIVQHKNTNNDNNKNHSSYWHGIADYVNQAHITVA